MELSLKRDLRAFPRPFCHMEKMAICELESGFSPDTESSGTLTLECSVSRTLRSKCWLFIIRPVYGIQLQQPKQLCIGILAGLNPTN